MHLTQISLSQFRAFEHAEIALHPAFNVLVGINGTGKSTVLEALRIALGSLFLELDKIEDKIISPSILDEQVRLHQLERQYPVEISATAQFDTPLSGEAVTWTLTKERAGGRTTRKGAKAMASVSQQLRTNIAHGTAQNAPLVAYYSVDRFKKEKNDVGFTAQGSRLRGYYHALDPRTNLQFFIDFFSTETLAALQHQAPSVPLALVQSVVAACIADCERVYFDIRRQELLIALHSTREPMPFYNLSDGVRIMLALVMELTFRCYLLNPHLGIRAAAETSGVVLIDELDLHLHPSWQKKVVGDLQRAFPCIQFIVTTHAPLVIGSLQAGHIVSLAAQQVYAFPNQYGRDANAILREMDTEPMAENLAQELDSYFAFIERGNAADDTAQALRARLEARLGTQHPELERADMLIGFFA